jgi:hypothetical protein
MDCVVSGEVCAGLLRPCLATERNLRSPILLLEKMLALAGAVTVHCELVIGTGANAFRFYWTWGFSPIP